MSYTIWSHTELAKGPLSLKIFKFVILKHLLSPKDNVFLHALQKPLSANL